MIGAADLPKPLFEQVLVITGASSGAGRATLIRPASMNTPLFNKAKTQLGAMPQPLGPVYGLEVYAAYNVLAAHSSAAAAALGAAAPTVAHRTKGRTLPGLLGAAALALVGKAVTSTLIDR